MRGNFDDRQVTQAALAFGRELANGFDVVADKLDPVGGLGIEGKDIENAAAPAEFSWQLNRFHALEGVLDQPGGYFFQVRLASHLEPAALLQQLCPIRDWLEQGLQRGQQEA